MNRYLIQIILVAVLALPCIDAHGEISRPMKRSRQTILSGQPTSGAREKMQKLSPEQLGELKSRGILGAKSNILENIDAMQGLVRRIAPAHADKFVFRLKPDSIGKYSVWSDGQNIVIEGSDKVSQAVGLNRYLREYCLCDVSWDAHTPVVMPDTLPIIKGILSGNAKVNDRFFLNYCTYGYTMPWWQWPEWERFIDWMALNGVTMPLAITGQEAVWQEVWRDMGLDDKTIRHYFTGPAHLPWHRMSNIDGWQGPLPQEWIDSQRDLQRLILERERAYGMTPVLPAFAGHVPKALGDIYPDAIISQVSKWGAFDDKYRCYFLDPTDPLFARIQKAYIDKQTALFGTNHLYGIDPFNEIDPPTWDPETLADMSRHIYSSLSDADPDAIWVQMGWLFYNDSKHWTPEIIKAFLGAVPIGKMLMLDYFCEDTEVWRRTDAFHRQPYIWCYLGNFGNNTMMVGNFRDVSRRISDVFAHGGSNLRGIGSTLEGFGVNRFMYEYVLDRAWDTGIDDDTWIDRLADVRTGAVDSVARKAWHTICDSIYVSTSTSGQATLTNAHPTLEGHWRWTTKPCAPYPQQTLWQVWNELLSVDSDRDSHTFDIVNVGRQWLGNQFAIERDSLAAAYYARDIQKAEYHGQRMRQILEDMDRLLSCHPDFSLRNWIESARRHGTDTTSQDYYERNARTILTVWGDSNSLTDYANRNWSGLTSSYYAPRWHLFIDMVLQALRDGDTFDQEAFDRDVREMEIEWTDPQHRIDYAESGDAKTTARGIIERYK